MNGEIMKRPNRGGRFRTAAALGMVATFALGACSGGGGDNPLQDTEGAGTPAPQGTVVVGSANFPENVLLGEIYAQALEAKGVNVEKKLNIGSREVIYKSISGGELTVLPEYNGALLAYLDDTSTADTTETVNAELNEKLPEELTLLDSAAAEDKDSLVVHKETADRYNLRTIADLEPVAGELILGGPPEFKTRRQGSVGLKEVYGIEFREFRSLDTAGPVTINALKAGDIDVANLFTTDPAVATDEFVVLDDPENLFSAQNVTPLVYEPALDDTIRDTLNAVSAELDTPMLLDMMQQVVTAKEDPDKVAAEWLRTAGL